jgi:16S rRNA (cytosine1402-N4)-methyltransferase
MALHIPVLAHEVVAGLLPKKGSTVLDGTLGHGGHARLLGAAIGSTGTLIGLELDRDALGVAEETLKDLPAKKILRLADYRSLDRVLEEEGISELDVILLDLGIGSHQIESGRGFSFMEDGPLSMSFSQEENVFSAKALIGVASEKELEQIIRGYGEEKNAHRIAQAIVEARSRGPIEKASELAEIIRRAVPRKPWQKIDPATKTFQALRIAVNDELGALGEALPKAWKVLTKGGRLGVISFHSLEDRIVKQFFKQKEEEGEGRRITKKPIVAGPAEITENPRSRSAKLRIIEKLIT